jgi:hypothetical protein
MWFTIALCAALKKYGATDPLDSVARIHFLLSHTRLNVRFPPTIVVQPKAVRADILRVHTPRSFRAKSNNLRYARFLDHARNER